MKLSEDKPQFFTQKIKEKISNLNISKRQPFKCLFSALNIDISKHLGAEMAKMSLFIQNLS